MTTSTTKSEALITYILDGWLAKNPGRIHFSYWLPLRLGTLQKLEPLLHQIMARHSSFEEVAKFIEDGLDTIAAAHPEFSGQSPEMQQTIAEVADIYAQRPNVRN